jgi:hypothetical protein
MPMLFQIEEPDGSPLDEAAGSGVAVGIDLSGPHGLVAVSVGGNAEILHARDGATGPETAGLRDGAGRFVPAATAAAVLALRIQAERALARPVTHAVIAVAGVLDREARTSLADSAGAGELVLMRVLTGAEAEALAAGAPPSHAAALGAAVAAEEDGAAAALPS